MPRRNQQLLNLKVGTFISLALGLFFAFIFFLGSDSRFLADNYLLKAYFKDVSGLRNAAPIYLSGINVGQVKTITFNSDKEVDGVALLVVHMEIAKEYQKMIREDSLASIVTQGLLGDKMIHITVGSQAKPMLKAGESIKVSESTGFNQMLAKGEGVLDNINGAAAHLEDILREIKEGDGFVHELIYADQGKEIVKDMNSAMKEVEEMSVQLNKIMSKINRGKGTVGALINDPSLFYDLKSLIGKANRNKIIRTFIRETLRTREKKNIRKR